MEVWDVYDSNRRKTSKQIKRGSPLSDGEYHLVVHICIFNSAGEMLIQQRQSFKEGWPNLWDVTAGGSVLSGESSNQAASRELFEELGLAVSFEAFRPNLTINFDQGFDDFYLLEMDTDLGALVLQQEEVQAVRWANEQEIQMMITEGSFIPYYGSLVQLFFDMKGNFGCQSQCEVHLT